MDSDLSAIVIDLYCNAVTSSRSQSKTAANKNNYYQER